MLGRKQSLRGEVILADYGADELSFTERSDILFINQQWVRILLRSCAFLSLVSICLNTPVTFQHLPNLIYITFAIDLIVTFVFTAEMFTKIKMRGLLHGDQAYLKDRWCQFDGIMLLFLIISVILHGFEITGFVDSYSFLSCLRAPRPLILVRLIRVTLKFNMPKQRINQIFKRSSQQIYNVTLFFLFFMALYSLLGVQLFAHLGKHCVRNGTDPTDVKIKDLEIPDSHCSMSADFGYQCPEGMICMELLLPKAISGFSSYDHIVYSFFTVYQAASQEGWSHLMYNAMDSLPPWRAVTYYSSLIFFLAWLVKNVFIAVITETFNEIRVQFQQMWGARQTIAPEVIPQVLRGNASGWRLVEVDYNQSNGRFRAPLILRKFVQSASFQVLIMVGILVDAIIAASVRFDYNGKRREDFFQNYYYCELFMTFFFNAEVLLKICCYGFKGYFKLSIHKFELMLAVGCTLHIIPKLFATSFFTCFQVLRIVRLIKASPVLEDFMSKIFGPGKKLGSIILFTMCLLVVTSSISMQLFCCLKDYNKFNAFPEAFMSMFQILTQEAWTDLMNETMLLTGDKIGPLVAIYFILYHLFVSLIVLSLFVAVILDNLELDEDIKKVKQLKAREQSAGISEELPLRLKVFEHFPDSPQMVKLNKAASEFAVPKIRESFLRGFIDDEEEESNTPTGKKANLDADQLITYRKQYPIKLLNAPSKVRNISSTLKRTCVGSIVNDCNYQRLLVGDSGQLFMPTKSERNAKAHFDGRSVRRSVRGSVKMKHAYEHLKENEVFSSENAETSRNPQEFDIKVLRRKRQQAEMKRNQREEDLRENHPFFDTPLFIVGRESKFRRFCQTIIYARYNPKVRDPVTGKERKIKYKGIHNLIGLVSYLDWIMIIITTMSCCSMLFEEPEYRVYDHTSLQIMEYVFVITMSFELALKTFADGLLFTPKALVRDVGGVMDLFIFMVSVIFLIWMPSQVRPRSKEQLIYILRCVRPLRIFSLVPHMRQVVYELCRGFKEILLVSVLIMFLMFTFACYGVHMFGGKLARCNDPEIHYRHECVGLFRKGLYVTNMKLGEKPDDPVPIILVPRVWANPRRFNFDSIGNAMLALFEVLSFKGWLDIRDIVLQRLGVIHTIYIHVYVFLGCMIGLTLFVGVVIANYGENKGTALLTVDQRRWCDLKKRLKIAQPLHLPPRPDNMHFRAFFYDITQNLTFKRILAFLVLTNSLLLCVAWDKHLAHAVPLGSISCALTMGFVIEVIIKSIAFTPRGYWQSRRNRYDFLVTFLGVIFVILHISMMNELSYTFGFIVVILRFFTITGKHATLKMLMLTVAVSVYKSFFIIMGMFLLILYYAFMGVILFGSIKYGENINRQANFRTAANGIVTLFRIVTGEDWNKMMHDAAILPPYCTLGKNYWETDCGDFLFSLLYFCSFYVFLAYIVLNLLVAIIIESFSLFYSNEEDALLSYADIRNFQNTWNLVDTQQRGAIPVKRVPFLIRLLKGRLEVDLEKDKLLFKHMVHEMERLHNSEDVTFHDALNMLSYRSVDIRKSLQLEELIAREELEFLIVEEVAKKTIRSWLDKCLRRIKQQKQSQSLIHSLRQTNEPFFANLQLPIAASSAPAPSAPPADSNGGDAAGDRAEDGQLGAGARRSSTNSRRRSSGLSNLSEQTADGQEEVPSDETKEAAKQPASGRAFVPSPSKLEKVEEVAVGAAKSADGKPLQRSETVDETLLSPTGTQAASSASAKWKKKQSMRSESLSSYGQGMSLTSSTTSPTTTSAATTPTTATPLPASAKMYLTPGPIEKKETSLHKTAKLVSKMSGLSTPIRSLSETQEDLEPGDAGWLSFTSNVNLKKSETLSATALTGQQFTFSSPGSRSNLQHIATIVDDISSWWESELNLKDEKDKDV